VAENSAANPSLWKKCLRALESELPEQDFNTWIRSLQAIETAEQIRLLAPNRFVVNWVQSNCLEQLQGICLLHSPSDRVRISIEVGSQATVAPISVNGREARTPRRLP
jgi:chromosomal replication initiator protein